MGIKTYNPYTPSRRNMTGSDFSEITKKTPELLILREIKKTAFRQRLSELSMIRTERQISL